MKMIYNGTPMKSLHVHHFEMNTNDCTMIPSDLQAGVTAFAKGKKVTGTGKCFEFANYGQLETNMGRYVPSMINIVGVSSLDYPVKLLIPLNEMKNKDFSSIQEIGSVTIDGVDYALTAQVSSNIFKINCEKTFFLEVFYGKDNYV